MKNYGLVAALLLFATPCAADVRLPKVLASHMVLQRDSDVKLWGWAEPGEEVVVSGDWQDEKATTKADAEGKWSVTLKTGEAGGPHRITVAGKNSIELEDVLFGEVWLASGQSNMEMPLVSVSGAYTGIQDFAKEVAEANHPEIRLFQAGNFSSQEPLDDVQPGIEMYGVPLAACEWKVCTPQAIPTFASTAYFFARELQQTLKVPVGIIDSSWGGTAAEAWTPIAGLKAVGNTAAVEQAEKAPQQADQKIPSRLYNGMIHPLRNFTIKGVIWYQGEGNAEKADKYRELFSTMITQWREVFKNDFPFYFVQISPFQYKNVNSAFLREAQLQTLSLPKTGMVVTMDLGHLTDIHPKNKQEVGRRLALLALANDYDQKVAYAGPAFKEVSFEAGKATLTFEQVGDGLATRDEKAPDSFEIAGEDKVFHPATAAIEGATIVVSSDQVPEPKAVRYAFSNEAMPNLMNKAGLPASSFRTDKW